jgi:hypothetical protein
MGKKYCDLTTEEKRKHCERTAFYSKKHKEMVSTASLKYYNANKESCAIKAKLWRNNNKEYIQEKQREDKRKRKLWSIEYLGGVCSNCKETYHPAVYEFHHIDPTTKDRDPSKMMSLSLVKLTTELDKCVLLCANCHRIEHHGKTYGS